MSEYQYQKEFQKLPNTFNLFLNDKKKSDTYPDLTGVFIDGNGVEWWVSAWKNTSREGLKYITGRIGNKKEPLPAHSAAKANGFQKQDDSGEDTPW